MVTTPETRLDDVERPAVLSEAQRAFTRLQDELRRLGAVGEIGVGYDPERPIPERWWARCVQGPVTDPRPLLAQGFPSGFDALKALVELAHRPRRTR